MVLKKVSNKTVKNFKSRGVKVRGYYNILMFLIMILADRLTKIWASTSGDKDYGIFAFTYVINTGAGFSILENMNILLAIISILAISAIIYFHKEIPRFSALTIISGIIGNLIDRLMYGGVIDFINFKFWPIFNIADSLICIGVIYWIIAILIDKKATNTTNRKTDAKKR
jgi:signal peptidase II